LPSPRTTTRPPRHRGHLLQYLEGGGERLGEDGHPVRDGIRDAMEVRLRNDEEVGERPVGLDDPSHPAGGTVAPEPGGAPGAGAAGEIDLADHALAGEGRILGGHHVAHPLVPGGTPEAQVPAGDLQVGAANAGEVDADERLTSPRHRIGDVARERQPGSVPAERSHAGGYLRRVRRPVVSILATTDSALSAARSAASAASSTRRAAHRRASA